MRVLPTVLPTVAIVFVGFFVIGLAMPVLPLFVHQRLGLDFSFVGLVGGATFAASLLSRFFAGDQADIRGAMRAVITGFAIAAAGGAFYYLSLRLAGGPHISVTILLLGRALLGAFDSVIITGALSWALALVGPRTPGTVIALVGTAIFFAYAVAAPAGIALYARYGVGAIAFATTVIPLAALLLIAPLRAVPLQPHDRPSFGEVLDAIRLPGFGTALSGIGFGAIITFIPLYFVSRGWGSTWIAFTTFSLAFVTGRLLFGNLPDRFGGAKSALICVVVEAAGQTGIWLAHREAFALASIALTGIAYALVYPAFGVEAVRRAPPQSRGLTMGVYTACLDLALGSFNPMLGMTAGTVGIGSVLLTGALMALCAAPTAMRIISASERLDRVHLIECAA